jgi:hypothetical protein
VEATYCRLFGKRVAKQSDLQRVAQTVDESGTQWHPAPKLAPSVRSSDSPRWRLLEHLRVLTGWRSAASGGRQLSSFLWEVFGRQKNKARPHESWPTSPCCLPQNQFPSSENTGRAHSRLAGLCHSSTYRISIDANFKLLDRADLRLDFKLTAFAVLRRQFADTIAHTISFLGEFCQ